MIEAEAGFVRLKAREQLAHVHNGLSRSEEPVMFGLIKTEDDPFVGCVLYGDDGHRYGRFRFDRNRRSGFGRGGSCWFGLGRS